MEIIKTKIRDCLIIQPDIYEDDRGFFFESFQDRRYAEEVGLRNRFVQDSHSHSVKDVIRGLHFQKNHPQGKLIRVLQGEIFDVAVDLRRASETFGCWESVILSDSNKAQFWVPPEFAHGFLVLSDTADVEYKTTDYYYPSDEASIIWNDPDLQIPWPIDTPILSLKDRNSGRFSDLK